MNRFMRFYNQNRKTFWVIIIAAIIIINVPRMLNDYIKKRNEQNSNNTATNVSVEKDRNISSKPTISGEKIEEKTTVETVNIIDEFMNYCNSKEIEKAYDLLSNDCKERLFPELKDFQERYYNKVFSQKRNYNIETWVTTSTSVTYKVVIMEDMLSTGKSSDFNITEYYTIVVTGEGKRLNINNYIGKKLVTTENTVNNIRFRVLEKHIYSDYVIYKLSVQNNTKNEIMIDSKEKNRTVNITNEKGQPYYAFLNEIAASDLIILPGITKEIEIKFNKMYNPDYKEKSMIFNDIVLDTNNKNERTNIKIDIE